MKILIIGLGSIGSRHCRNLHTLRPDYEIIGADPGPVDWSRFSIKQLYFSWRDALNNNRDIGAAIITSPTTVHHEQATALASRRVPFYVEKPVCTADEIEAMPALISACGSLGLRCAVGHQYRFASVMAKAAPAIQNRKHVRFCARDDLLARYGADCLSAIAAHPIDTALWLLGPAAEIDIETDGLSVRGTIRHVDSGISEYDCRIDQRPRISTITSEDANGRTWNTWSLEAANLMYLDALSAWLAWVEGGECDPRLAMLVDGLAVVEVMAQTRKVVSTYVTK